MRFRLTFSFFILITTYDALAQAREEIVVTAVADVLPDDDVRELVSIT